MSIHAELVLGAARHIACARACGPAGAQRNGFINGAVSQLHALRGSLDLTSGDTMAASLDDLYEYVAAQLRRAQHPGCGALLDEVSDLLNEIRMAWFALPR